MVTATAKGPVCACLPGQARCFGAASAPVLPVSTGIKEGNYIQISAFHGKVCGRPSPIWKWWVLGLTVGLNGMQTLWNWPSPRNATANGERRGWSQRPATCQHTSQALRFDIQPCHCLYCAGELILCRANPELQAGSSES